MQVRKQKSVDTLIIARHGKPALSRKVFMTWRGYREWWGRYDAGGIVPNQKVPPKLLRWVEQADLIISSPLRRAVESAEFAAGRAVDFTDIRLIEAALPPPHFDGLKFRPKVWGTFARIAWFLGWSDGMESHQEARQRTNEMCDALAEHAAGGKIVYVSAHGWINRMLKGSLLKRGWKMKSQNGDLHWSFRRYERPTNYNK
ncbi:broad specificity phosphatase PhoE [Litorimonas taeanensis]|uniref:Broad specificity phosphatase PhoE n=1 Tax=Litorimonas taeanensis TaxID=568099 RepID=A0A420WIN3_9PROT|nr:histidine phosphatase family protein [Litorimonas taeanensis]RKQ70847.1 broad specificity phosphatase PhoE [Litorimonas taeanensis]